MTDTYDSYSDEASRMAVAELMYACGMAVMMDYSDVFSGAVDIDAAIALTEHFGFSESLELKYRDFYRADEWALMLCGELSAGRPVLYYGFSPAGGHAFICDGYMNDDGNAYFHFNWGWSGVSDGYFMADLLNPAYIGNGAEATGFNREQSAIFGLKPADGSSDGPSPDNMLCFGFFAPGKTSYTRNSNLLFGISTGLVRAGFFNMSTRALEVTPGIIMRSENGEEIYTPVMAGLFLR
nr:C10 family peptidase [uncultured Duncaniella sp.]